MSEIITVTTRGGETYEVSTDKEECARLGVEPNRRFTDKNDSEKKGKIIGISASRVDPGGCAKEKRIVLVELDTDKGSASFYPGKNPEEMGIELL